MMNIVIKLIENDEFCMLWHQRREIIDS